jgi:hypothetical protein
MPDTEKYILIFGGPVDGFSFIGPFDEAEGAAEYADNDQGIRDDA